MKKTHKLRKALKISCGILWNLAVILLLLTLISVLGAKIRGQVPNIMGYSLLRITTGSMEPQIPTGTYILVKKVPPKEIHRGDIISFYSSDPLIQGMPNTHRVWDTPIYDENGVYYTTKGDANGSPDRVPALSQNLIGRYVKNMEGITKFSHFCTAKGMLAAIIILQILGTAMMIGSLCSFGKRARIRKVREDHHERRKK